MNVRAAVGRFGEDVAVRYLEEQGYRVVARNWRCRYGELDIVAEDGDCLVVCEVKTRRSAAFGPARGAVDAAKLARLRRLAAAWLADQERAWPRVRIDVVAITTAPSGPPSVDHLRAVG